MKRIIGITLALTLAVLSVFTAGAYDKAYQKGDANLNGRVTIDDATLIQRYVAELADYSGFWAFFAADTDNNGVIDINDVSNLQRDLAQFETMMHNIPDGNATIAQAAVTMAYEHKGDGYMAEGTEVYQGVFDLTIQYDYYKRSCDRFVCTAVRWSGADDNYPIGDVGVQADYIYEHPEKWEPVFGSTFMDSDTYRSEVPDGLQPGDIIIEYSSYNWRSHTFVYCGEGLIAAIFPDSADEGYCTASASYDDVAPECRWWYLSYNYFRAFRCKQYESNPKYKNVGLKG